MPTPYRLLTFLMAFLIPPFLVTAIGALSTMNQIMLPQKPEPVEISKILGESEFSKKSDYPDRLNAIIVTSKSGTQVTELLTAYQLLSESGKFNVLIASDLSDPIPLTGGVSIYPEIGFDEAPKPDLLVIPSLLDTKDRAVLNYLRNTVDIAPLILALGEGVRILGEIGWLSGHRATTHPIAIDSFQSEFKTAQFIKNKRVVVDQTLVTAAGIKSSADATLQAIEILLGKELPNRLSKLKNILWIHEGKNTHAPDLPSINTVDLSYLALRAAYLWEKLAVGIYLYPGISEIGLASMLDTLPRSMSLRTVTLGEVRQPILTKNGLKILPAIPVEESPLLDLLIVPPGVGKTKTSPKYQPLANKNIHHFLLQENITAKSFQNIPEGQAFQKALDLINQLEGARISELISRLIVYPEWQFARVQSSRLERVSYISLLLRPFAFGLVGLLLAFGFERRMRRRAGYDNLSAQPKNT